MSNNKLLIEWREDSLSVGITDMDNTHKEFIDIINSLGRATDDQFPALFNRLLEHTQQHFQYEDIAMEKSGFPPKFIHRNEHYRILDELKQLAITIDTGNISVARNFVCRYLPEWFPIHAATMDRALACHLKASGIATD